MPVLVTATTPAGPGWVLQTTYAERDIPKAAGFRWDPAGRRWWTKVPAIAARLAHHADAATQAALLAQAGDSVVQAQQQAQERATALEASRATSAPAAVVAALPVPAGLALLPYQAAGVARALDVLRAGSTGVLIGDEPGLGKTIQAIVVANATCARRVLVVVPASLRLNWQREWLKWTTQDGQTVGVAIGDHFPGTDVVVINYDIIGRHRPAIDARQWQLLVLDEAHALKNPDTQRTRAVLGAFKRDQQTAAGIRAERTLVLTGTPILNRPVELWPLLRALDPTGLGRSFFGFAKRYCAATQGRWGWDFTGSSNLPELQDRLRASFLIRRLKADVLLELPPKRRQVVALPLNGAAGAVTAEREAYEAVQAAILQAEADLAVAEAGGDTDGYSAAVARLKQAQRVSFEAISRLRHDTAVAKIPYLVEHLKDAVEGGKIVFFAHHLDVLKSVFAAFGAEAVLVTGDTTLANRQAAVDRFQNDPTCKLFVGGIIPAGVGITLTASSHVVFGELDWRPGIVSQAEDRTHRIGQANSVLVQHLVFDGSIDARIAQTIVAKQEVIDRALDRADAAQDEGFEPVDEASVLARIAQAEERAIASGERETANRADRQANADRQRVARHTARARDEAEAVTITPAQVAAVHDACRLLAGLDEDRAQERNDLGYNKGDSYLGHALARLPALAPLQAVLARRLVRKYHRQLGPSLLAATGAAPVV